MAELTTVSKDNKEKDEVEDINEFLNDDIHLLIKNNRIYVFLINDGIESDNARIFETLKDMKRILPYIKDITNISKTQKKKLLTIINNFGCELKIKEDVEAQEKNKSNDEIIKIKEDVEAQEKNKSNDEIIKIVTFECKKCGKLNELPVTKKSTQKILESKFHKDSEGNNCDGNINIVHNEIKKIPIILKDIKELFNKYFYIKDFEVIDVLFGTVYSHILPDDPLWIMIIAQSAGIKTELLRSLGESVSEHVHPTSILTENSIISGSKLKKEIPLVQKIHNKIWTIKDLTSILTDRSEKVNKISSQLREIYDGYIRVDSGMEGGSKDAKVRTTLIMAVTPYIDSVRIFKTELGERLLYIRIPEIDDEGENKLKEALLDNSSVSKQDIRNEISNKVKDFISLVFQCKDTNNKDINIDDENIKSLIKETATFIAELRANITWDYKHHEIIDVSIKESPARLMIELKKLAYSLKIVRGKDKYENEEKSTLLRVMMNSVPQHRMLSLNAIIKNLKKDVELINLNVFNTEIMNYIYKYKIPRTTAENSLKELEALHIIECSYEKDSKESSKLWKFKDEFFNKYKNILNCISDYKGLS